MSTKSHSQLAVIEVDHYQSDQWSTAILQCHYLPAWICDRV